MKVKQRDIILIDFPFSDLTGAKVRPALVTSHDKYNSSKLDAVVLGMTSNLSGSQYKVIVENRDLESGNLPLKSAIGFAGFVRARHKEFEIVKFVLKI